MSTKEKDKFIEKFLKKHLHKPVKDLTNAQYHGLGGTWSSSQFKDMLEDDDYFIKKYIKREIDRSESEAMDTGTYFHTAILEPHKLEEEIAIFQGSRRYGKDWDKFKAKHEGKVIITVDMQAQGDQMVKAVKNSPNSMKYLDGDPEVSLFVELLIHHGRIYAPAFKKVLATNGWEDVDAVTIIKADKGYRMVVKVRADCLGDTFVSDLKSTSGNARKAHDVRNSISQYRYDLSAALYLDMFNLINPEIRDFIWVFASKKSLNAAPWRATQNQILVGRAKYSHAAIRIADCARANWELVDCLLEAEPLPYEMEWLKEKDTDLL